MDKESLQLLLDQGLSIGRIAKRFGKDPSTVSYWMHKHGLVSPYRDKHAAKGGLDRQRLEALLDRGMTIAAIAAEVGRSQATVRHWLREYGLRTKNARGRRPVGVSQAAKEAGLLTMTMTCPRHGETRFILEGRGYYRCKQCRSERVARRRRDVKAILVREAGGKCQICGYDRWIGALHFHHLDPESKQFNIALRGVGRSLARLRAEARKCVLLCADCHSEVEAGIHALPDTVSNSEEP
jgi:transposase-like protein